MLIQLTDQILQGKKYFLNYASQKLIIFYYFKEKN